MQVGPASKAHAGLGGMPSIIISLLNIAVAFYILVTYPEKHKKPVLSKKETVAIKWASVIVALLVIIGSFAALYIAGSYLQDDTGIIKGVQTRYFYPALFALAMLPLWRGVSVNKVSQYAKFVLIASSMLLLTQAIVICIYFQWGVF